MVGVSAIAHVASNLTFKADPNAVIPEVIAGIKSILKSAASSATVKRFVFTSSSTAAASPIPNKVFHIDSKTWNDAVVDEAWAPPPYEPMRAYAVYSASKVEAERALWKFVEENKPGFVVNAVLPDTVFGKILDRNLHVSTAGFVNALYKGEQQHLPPQWFVDVQDVALLHLACMTDPLIKNERIIAFAEPWNWNDILRIMRKLRPNEKIIDDYADDNARDLSTVDNARGNEILKGFGKSGFTSLEESVKGNIDGLQLVISF
ncbi:putative Aldehyde reductase 2 [Glarea lozoyensis 74030]|uniref:Putative Aldehyde reductase 2 n=1 Tax=Glarea lozoyensis (strain ATCC 74030 / MF5533) TaxID=1104152 RepID=H0EES1_GLAL7|nr:putative Aldehyde reductase 2 [Glarea lozoyensis 74030]